MGKKKSPPLPSVKYVHGLPLMNVLPNRGSVAVLTNGLVAAKPRVIHLPAVMAGTVTEAVRV